MFARIPSACLSLWGRTGLALALVGLPLYASCTSSEDTEPFVPAQEGAKQPPGGGSLLSEADACERLRDAASSAYDKLGCDAPELSACPGFLRPGGGVGCYEYFEDSVEACEKSYADAFSCVTLAPCVATAQRNDSLPTCELATDGAGGAGGVIIVGGSGPAGGAPPEPAAGGSGLGGAAQAGAGGA